MTNEEKEKWVKENPETLNTLLVDVCYSQRDTIRRMNYVIGTVVVALSLIICTMVISFFKYENQFDTKDMITTTTTTDLSTSGENANINNVENGNMYNDNATHKEVKK